MSVAVSIAPPVALAVTGDLTGAGGVSGSPALPLSPIQALLAAEGANAVAWWTVYDPGLPVNPGLSIIANEVDAWTDQIGGRTVVAPGPTQRPAFAADGTNFQGRAVVQTNVTNNRCLKGSGFAGSLLSGTRPYILLAGRYRVSGGFGTAFDLGIASSELMLHMLTSGQFRGYVLPAFASLTGDLFQHCWRWWADGTNITERMDTAGIAQTASAAAISSDLTVVSVGTDAPGFGGIASFSAAEIIVLRSYPGAAVDEAFRAAIVTKHSSRPPLPASAVEYWHGDFGASATQAVGQILGTTLPAQGTPVVGPDPGFFNGRNVYQSIRTGSHFWFAFGLTPLALAGTRPWIYSVSRWRTVPGGVATHLYGLGGSVGGAYELDMRHTFTAGRRVISGGSAGNWFLDNGNAHLVPRRMKTWVEGTTANFTSDEVTTTGPAVPLTVDINCVGLGSSSGVSGSVADGSIALLLVCSSKPTAAEEAALDAWAKTYYGLT